MVILRENTQTGYFPTRLALCVCCAGCPQWIQCQQAWGWGQQWLLIAVCVKKQRRCCSSPFPVSLCCFWGGQSRQGVLWAWAHHSVSVLWEWLMSAFMAGDVDSLDTSRTAKRLMLFWFFFFKWFSKRGVRMSKCERKSVGTPKLLPVWPLFQGGEKRRLSGLLLVHFCSHLQWTNSKLLLLQSDC